MLHIIKFCEKKKRASVLTVHAMQTTAQLILSVDSTWGVQVLRYPNFFSGMEADRNVKVVGGDVAVL